MCSKLLDAKHLVVTQQSEVCKLSTSKWCRFAMLSLVYKLMYTGIRIIHISSSASSVDRWKWKTLKTRQRIPTMFLRWLALTSNQLFCYIIGSCTLHFDVCNHDSDQSLRSILIKFSTHVIWHKISVKWAKWLKPFQIGSNVVILNERYVLRAFYFLNQSHLTISSKKLHKSNDSSLVCIQIIEKWLTIKKVTQCII